MAHDTRLDSVLQEIERSFGVGSVMRDGIQADAPDVIPTGSKALDTALGIGGLPRGRIVEAFGPEMSGKSTLALHVVANAQKQGLQAAYVDVEHALDPKYAAAIGVDLHALLLAQPESGEEACEIANRLISSGGIGVLVIDSLAMLATRAELAGEIGEAHIGGKARLIGQALRKLAPNADKNGCLVLAINQLRESIGITFGSPLVVPGGRAPKYASSVRIEMRTPKAEKKTGADPHRVRVTAMVRKNKLAPPLRSAEFVIEFGKGIKDLANQKVK